MISTRGRYALRVMIDIANHSTGNYVPMKEVALRQNISLKYIEQIAPVLTKAMQPKAATKKTVTQKPPMKHPQKQAP